MARGFPTCDGYGSSCDGGGGGSGRQYITENSFPSAASSSYPRVDSFYYSSLDSDSIGDVFFGSDDIKDGRDLTYKEDVLESYRRETARKSLRQEAKKGSFSVFGCFEFLKYLCSCCRCIF